MGRLHTPPAATDNSRMTTYVQCVLGLNHSSRPAALTDVFPLILLICSLIKHATRRKTSARDVSTAKRQKKMMSLSHKVDLLNRLSRGQSVASVGRLLGINKFTIRSIQKNEKTIREIVEESAVPNKVVTHVWDVHIGWRRLSVYGLRTTRGRTCL